MELLLGLWVDEGEFETIIAALLEELLTKSFPDYLKASLEEATELVNGPETLVSEWRDFMNVLRFAQYRLLIENPALRDSVDAVQKSGLG